MNEIYISDMDRLSNPSLGYNLVGTNRVIQFKDELTMIECVRDGSCTINDDGTVETVKD